MQFESAKAERLRQLDEERSRKLGEWEFEPAKPGYITTIFGRYKSGEPAGLAYTCCGDTDQQNADAEFICAAANSIGPLLDERATMMLRLARYRAALRDIVNVFDARPDIVDRVRQLMGFAEWHALKIARDELGGACIQKGVTDGA